MNKTFVASLENHDVYLINTTDVSFYFNISKDKESTNITLDINYKNADKIDDIINYYKKIDNYNISLVVPIIKLEENFDLFKYQSNMLSKIINCSYKLLTSNDVLVKDNINLIKHKSVRSDFVDFFINKFANRVRYISLDKLVQEEVPYNKINAANISFVVGRPELELTIKDEEMNKLIKDVQEQKQEETINKKPKYSFATSGYVSYYLLGFLTAILTLLGITLLMK